MSVYDAAYEVDWERVPLPPGRLAELNRRSDILGLAQSLGHLGLLAATGAATWICAAQGWWLAFALALFAHGTVASFMINAVHELVHGTVFRTRWLNTVFVHIFAFVGWINHRGFWASHAEHHLYTLHHPHDSEVVLPIRFGLRGFVQGAILNPFGMTWPLRHHWRLARGKIAPGWEAQVLISQDRRRAVVSWSRSLFLGHAAVWAVSAWQGWWLLPILVSLTPCYGHLLFSLLNNTQHVGLKAGAKDFRENCRTIEVNAVLRFLYWHMNYHIEHHMYAAVPCYRLRALHREIAHALPPTPQGLAAAWGQIISDVVRQKAEPGWYERPVIPGKEAVAAEPVQAAVPTAPNVPTPNATITAKVWRCSICGFIYDEAVGLPAEGIAAGTAWADIPADWTCPDCGIAKADFAMVEVARPAPSAAPIHDDRAAVVVVGAGMAATALIEDLRRRDGARRIIQVTADAGDRYAKPQLSVALARGQTAADLVAESATDWSRRVGVDLRPRTRALAIDAGQRVLKTDGGDIAYGDLVLATGAAPMPLSLEGDAADAVFRINHLDDYRAFRGALKPGARVAILGAGLIGCEFANDLAQAGHAVTIIDPAPQPLGRLVPAEVGATLASALAGLGVDLRLGRSVRRIDHAAVGKTVILDDGGRVAADLVLAAIGLNPRLDLAKTAGLACARGIIVDGSFATSVGGIHALGDAVEIGGKVLPFVQPLQEGARVLAAALCGERQQADCSAWTISVKTPVLPLLIAPARSEGTWTVEHQPRGLIARCTAADGCLAGFVLAGTGVAQRQALVQEWTGAPALAR